MVDAATIMKRWSDGISSPQAKEKFRTSVEAVTESPMEAAAAQQEKMLARVTASITSGLWANRLRSVSLQAWKQRTIAKGAERLSSGAKAAEDKMRAHVQRMVPIWDNIRKTIRAMPNNSVEDGLERVRRAIEMQKEAVGKTY